MFIVFGFLVSGYIIDVIGIVILFGVDFGFVFVVCILCYDFLLFVFIFFVVGMVVF